VSQDDRMGLIERSECHVCHAPVGAMHAAYCSVSPGHVRPDTAVRVEYVPASQFAGAVEDRDVAVRLLNDAQTTIIDTDLRREWEAERARLRAAVGQ
jgi:hypothetical protein